MRQGLEHKFEPMAANQFVMGKMERKVHRRVNVISEVCVGNNTRVSKRGKKGVLKSQKEGAGLFLRLGYTT